MTQLIKKVFYLVLTISCLIGSLQAQEYYIRAYGGVTYYHGDLSPTSSTLSLSDAHPAFGIYAGMKLGGLVTLGARTMKGHISAYDSASQNPDKRRRNLHFESNVYELGLIADVHINHLWKNLNRYGIQLSLTTGVNVYHYNPKALYEGKWIALQPLMTEGEGLRQYLEQKPYHLTRINFPIGINAQFKIRYNLAFGIELAPRITFNDYLDDVSSVYINYNDLLALKGELTAIMANRSGELTGTGPAMVPTGTPRGDPSDADWYMFTGVYISYIIGAQKPPTKEPENPIK